MKISATHVLQPGNIHSAHRLLEVTLSGAEGVLIPADQIRRLAEAFERIKPQTTDFAAWRRLLAASEPVPVAAVVEVLAVTVQRALSWPVKFCAWRERPARSDARRPASRAHEGKCIYEIRSDFPGRAAADAALAMVREMMDGADSSALYKRFLKLMKKYLSRTARETPAAGSLAIMEAANRRGIPWSVMYRSQLVRIGMGRHARILKDSETSKTGAISKTLAKDKGMTNKILATAGLPVAMQRIVRREADLIGHAREIGYPLVVKPYDGNMGRGITIGVEDDAGLLNAFAVAREISGKVALERFIAGDEYRLLVIDGSLVAASQRRPAQVMGDGKSTVRQLVDQENRRPERDPILNGKMSPLKCIEIDEEAIEILAKQGFGVESTPPVGTAVYLRRVSNVSRGGETVDVTDQVHPSVRDLAQRAAGTIGLDICGIDYITPDITKDWRDSGGRICEVNSRPNINMQIITSEARGREITDAMLDSLFPPGTPCRGPVIALVGQPWQTAGMREAIEATFAFAGRKIGVVRTDPFQNACLPDSVALPDVQAVEWDTQNDGVVIEMTPDRVVEEGVGLEQLDLVLASPEATGEANAHLGRALERVARLGVVRLDADDATERALDALGMTEADLADAPSPVAAPDNDVFTALFVGDVGFGESYMHHPRVADLQATLSQHGHGYSMEKLQALLGLGDVTIANLEVPLCNRPDTALQHRKKYLGWCDPERTVDAIRAAEIGVVTLANNHALDCGAAGLSETLTRLRDAGIEAFGAGADAAEAGQPFIHRFDIRGVAHSLVVFAGFEYRERYDRRYKWYAGDLDGGVGLLDPKAIGGQISALRASLPKPTFVAFPHWGTDYEDITESQRESAAALIEAGVDLVIGHGAHIAQSVELIDGRPVLYNIGNFVWNTPGRFEKRNVKPLGLAVALTFDATEQLGPTLRIYPIVTDNAVTQFQNRPVTEIEFSEAADLLRTPAGPRLRKRHDKIGYSLECKFGGHRSTKVARHHAINGLERRIDRQHLAIPDRVSARLNGSALS